MRLPLRLLTSPRVRGDRAVRSYASSAILPCGTTATYRRVGSKLLDTLTRCPSTSVSPTVILSLRPHKFSLQPRPCIPTSRTFTSSAIRCQNFRHDGTAKHAPRQDTTTGNTGEGEAAKSGPSSEQSKEKSEGPAGEGKEEGKEENKKNDNQKEEPPPPPPHGNKSPWQVFTDTLKSEFQASKEWNESTKALGSSVNQFTENESVKRARAAYSAASGAATSTTSTAFKGTGKALGQTAAWTWDTTVVKGVRSGVNATGRGIDKATKPIRETEVFKTAVGSVKDVVDDGSSSRYGGWVEKEERRKQRELRELNEAAANGRPGRRVEKAEEDPK